MATVYFSKWLLLPSGEVLTNGAVAVDGPLITSVGTRATVRRTSRDRMVNCGELLLMPGFINMHTHLEENVVRGQERAAEETFTSWIAKRSTRVRQTPAKTIDAAVRLGARELLTNGMTTVVDSSRTGRSFAVLDQEPIRAWVIREVHDDGHTSPEYIQHLMEELGRSVGESARLTPGVGPYALFSLTPRAHRALIEYARRDNRIWFSHLAESAEELQAFSEHTGDLFFYITRRRPWPFGARTAGAMNYAITDNLIPNGAVLFHCNYTAGHELSLLAAKNVSIVLTPQYNQALGHKSFPVDVAMKRGINLCLGTESRTMSRSLNLFDELHEMKKAYPHIPATTLLRFVTVNPAKALRKGGNIGALTPGACADIIGVSFPHEGNEDLLEEMLQESPVVRFALVDGEEVIVDY